MLIYGTSNLGKNIELRAARNIEWDLKLDEYMDDSQYKAEDLKRLADRQRGSGSQNPPAQPPAPGKEPPPKENKGASDGSDPRRCFRASRYWRNRAPSRGPKGTSRLLENLVSRITRSCRSSSTSPRRSRATSPTRSPSP